MSMIVCDECKNEFPLTAVTIYERNVSAQVGQDGIELDFFVCPRCQKVYPIGFKDVECTNLLHSMEKLKDRIQRGWGLGRPMKSSVRLYEVLQREVRNRMSILKERYSGTFTLVASENNEEDFELQYRP